MAEEKFTEIHELATPSTILSHLDCPICKEVPFPPIFNCERGHIICSICRPKLIHCPLCKGIFSGRNFPLEAIILSSKHKCKYENNGCSLILMGDEMLKHLKKCSFQSKCTPCHLGLYTSCANSSEPLPFPMYLIHLKDFHMMLPSISPTEGIIIHASHVLNDVKETFWLGDYTIYDKTTFIIRQFMKKEMVYFGLALVGDETLAKKYAVEVTILSQVDKISKISWNIPVHSVMLREDEIMQRFCGVVPFSYIKAHSTSFSMSKGKKLKLAFSVKYQIIKEEALQNIIIL